jgi:copper(I)-binding protein
MTSKTLCLAIALAAPFAAAAFAQVVVKDAWVRATVAQQKATGAFMQITAAKDARLISVSSPVVPLVEIHEMSMQGSVMTMREVPALALPAGQAVELTPGGYHLMLLELKKLMTAGDTVPLTLVVEDKAGKRERVDVKAAVRAPGAAAKPDHVH